MSAPPLRLLYVCLSPGWGGLEMYMHRTGAPMRARGHDVVAAVRAGGRVAEACRDAGIPTRELRPGPGSLLAVPALAGLLRDHRVDLVHVHRSRDLGAVLAARALAGRGQVVFTEHMGGRSPKKDPYHRWVYARVARVLSISEEVRRRNLAALPITPEQSRLLYYGLDVADFDPAPLLARREALRAEFGLPADRVLVGLVGRVSAMKGHALLQRAMLRVFEARPEVDLVFVGDATGRHGGEPAVARELAAEAARHGVAHRVHSTGYTDRVREVTTCLDVAAVCSDDEAFGITLVEALALARPTVASRSGALPEILRDRETGLLYQAMDPEDLAARLLELLADPALRDRLGRAAREDVVARFSLARHLDELEAIYREVLEETGGSGGKGWAARG